MAFFNLTRKIESLLKQVERQTGDSIEASKCQICDGFGFINTPHGVKHCPCVYTHYNTVYYKRVFGKNYGIHFAEIEKLQGFERTKSYAACRRMHELILSDAAPMAIILCGGHGRGKTLSGCALLKELSDSGYPCYGFSFPEVVYQYRRGFDSEEWIRTHKARIRENRFIFGDEVWDDEAYGNPELSLKALRYICRTCEESDPVKWLLLTTNKSKQEIFRAFPSDLKDRFQGAGGYCKYIEEPHNQSLRRKTGGE